ncbi:NUDIX domain-containing protein [Streptomyces sp. NPDC005141]
MSRRSATSASPAVTAAPMATDFSAPLMLSRGDDVPPTRPDICGTAEAYLARHPLEREAKHEGALIIEPGDVELVHLVHLTDSRGARPRIGLVFWARSWSGAPEFLEPDQCVDWQWWDPQGLPAGVVPYALLATDGILGGRRLYSEMGW